jgi:hypothetical protein
LSALFAYLYQLDEGTMLKIQEELKGMRKKDA